MTPDATPPDSTPPADALLALPPAAELRAPPPPPRRRGRGVLFAGVAGACVLGAGLGLWARPGMSERQLALTPPTPPPPVGPVRTLQVVVDNRPAPLGAPMQVLPATDAKPQPAMALPVFTAPVRPPEPFVRAPVVAPPAPVQVASAEPPPRPFAAARLAPMIAAAMAAPKLLITRLEAPKPPPILLAKADPPHRADARAAEKAAAHKLKLSRMAEEKAEQAKADRLEAAREQAAEMRLAELKVAQAKEAKAKAAQVRVAKAEAARAGAKAEHLAQLAEAQSRAQNRAAALIKAKADKAEAIRLAKAEAKGRAEARAEARIEALAEAREEAQKQIRLASLVRTLKRVIPAEVRPHEAKPQPAPVRTAKLDRKHGKAAQRHEAVIEHASLKGHKAPHIVEPPSRAHAAPIVPPPPRPLGLMKVSAPRCGQRDPGEAIVCADPNLGAADRQLARAYQGARAAGVPDAQLLRQQQRWLAARTAAAREAPWAVHDVYMARIAELNGQAREAHGDGY
jgi:colicin import membrane protein